jgi:hypothetical protein
MLSLHIVISMREEFLGELGIFQNKVPDLFANYYQLKYPTKQQSADIIRRTCSTRKVEVHEENLVLLIKDLATVERGAGTTLERAVSMPAGSGPVERDFIIPPYANLFTGRPELSAAIDFSGKTIRVITGVQSQSVITRDLTFDRSSFSPIEGDPRQLRDSWSRRLGLELQLSKEGEPVSVGSADPIVRPGNESSPDPRRGQTPGNSPRRVSPEGR